MYKLCLNSRDELLVIDLQKIAFFQANGNYTQMNYISGENRLLTLGLTKIEEVIRISWPKGTPSPFVRLGRSLIVNQNYLSEISVLRQRLVLSDWSGNSHSLTVPKPLLKNYKEHIYKEYQAKINKEKNNGE
ncbi:MAG: LytTR family transcriptional regulator DNA-binding domain-containing protein [Muribaculaceae bacterium]|nr:LytTR family transcriptional regulator DNA-binding domain-containing protein [Muribaculaceae bacterium]